VKWIRWRGAAAFVIIAAIASAVWFLVVDRVVEHYIEKAGTSLVGAKVELGSADLSFFPLGLTLTGLQVADPSSPMRNAVECERIAGLVDGVWLLLGKTVIDEMSVEGVRLNTPRAYSGAVDRAAPGAAAEPPFLTFEIPDVMEVLKKEELESLRLAEEIKGRISSDRARFAVAVKKLPDEKKLKAYRERLEALKAKTPGPAGMLSKATSILALKKEIEADATNIKTLATDAETTAGYYRERVEFALGAPSRDLKRLAEKYAITPQGLTNLSRLFFGGELVRWTDTALIWRAKAESVMKAYKGDEEVEVRPRGKGADVRFPEREPAPDFLIRKAFVSVNIPSGDFIGEVLNITGDQHMLGAPMTFEFSGKKLKGLDSISLTGEMNRVVPERPRDYASFKVRGYRVKDIDVARGGSMPLALKSGNADLTVTAEIKGSTLDAGLKASLSELALRAGREGEKNQFLKAGALAISRVKGFGLSARAQGTVEDYDVSVSSDLDDVLKASAGSVIAEKAAAFKARLAREINEETKDKLAGLRSELALLTAVKDDLASRSLLVERLLRDVAGSLPSKGFSIPGF